MRLDGLALLEFGSTITLDVAPGESVCVVGPSGSGKSRLLRILAAEEKAVRGTAELPEAICIPDPAPRKARPQDLFRRKGDNKANHATNVLSQLGLWNARGELVANLPAGHAYACELVEAFMSDAGLVVLDEKLDRLDGWTLAGAMRLMRHCKEQIFLVSTNNLDLVGQFDHLIVMKEHQAVFAGRVADVASRGKRTVTIESHFQPGLRALVEPFGATISRVEGGIKIEAEPGQKCAAQLLKEGYGDIKYVMSDQPTIRELILGMI